MKYDVYMQYKNGSLSIWVNDSFMLSSDENLLEKFDGLAYLGFNGYFWGYERELYITTYSFWCQDQINDIYFDTKISDIVYYDRRLPTYIPAGSRIEIIANFSDVESYVVPHLYGKIQSFSKLTMVMTVDFMKIIGQPFIT